MTQAEEFKRWVQHWCPPQFHHEPMVQQLARAFSEALSCVEDCRREKCGQQPMRNNYPDPTYPP